LDRLPFEIFLSEKCEHYFCIRLKDFEMFVKNYNLNKIYTVIFLGFYNTVIFPMLESWMSVVLIIKNVNIKVKNLKNITTLIQL
jgi:hypothetical protein